MAASLRRWFRQICPAFRRDPASVLEDSRRFEARNAVDKNTSNELISFNVGGKAYAILSGSLENFPDSLLGSSDRRERFFRTKDGAIFLNRNSEIFEKVLDFYRTGVLECPAHINQIIFTNEIAYYGLVREAQECGLSGFETLDIELVSQTWRNKAWYLFEYPDSSKLARAISMLSIAVIITSIIAFCIETLPQYRLSHEAGSHTADTLDHIEVLCICWFTIELAIRFLLAPSKIRFARSWLNFIDLLSILPFLVAKTFKFDSRISATFLRVTRLTRVLRVLKLSRHTDEMKVLAVAVRDSLRELGSLVLFVLIGTILFSSALFYAEMDHPKSKIDSIPGAFWLSIVTMTTVGYGDVVPATPVGKLVCAVCGMTGILVIALPIPIIVNNFTLQYKRLKPIPKFHETVKKREELLERIKPVGLYTAEEYRLFSNLSIGTTQMSEDCVPETVGYQGLDPKPNGGTDEILKHFARAIAHRAPTRNSMETIL